MDKFYLLVGKRLFGGEDEIWTLGAKIFWWAQGTVGNVNPNTWGRQLNFSGGFSGLITSKMGV
ncbi:unnamed protein product [marine sediment metagenome]|uniref:Uncharacterized protein n=1 Tax=marine sediment metagenome TaxID=412755 RepID=X1E0U4_9ZZZZ